MANTIDQIRNQINIVDVVSEYIDLTKKGKNYWGLCPFHKDSNASMSVSPDKQMFKCFSCGHGGNVINFVSDYEKISFGKAIVKLGAKVGIKVQNNFDPTPKYSPQQEKLVAALKDAMDFFQYSLTTTDGEKALQYAHQRGLDNNIIEKYKIGYAPREGLKEFLINKGHDEAVLINASLINDSGRPFLYNRLIFGISNEFNDVVALSGRILEGEGPKYINSIESQIFNKSSVLYNLNNSHDIIRREGEVIITEGFMDVIALHKAGINNSVAIMGTALTKEHVSFLKERSVTLMLDSDNAGINATLKSIQLLMYFGIPTYIAFDNNGKDIDEIFKAYGAQKVKEIIDNKVNAMQFVYAWLKKQHDTMKPQGIEKFVAAFSKFIANATELEKDFYINKMADEFKLSSKIISAKIPGYRVTKMTLPKPKEKKVVIDFKPKNYSYILIRSMVKKPMLIEVLKKNPAFFEDAVMLRIAKYITYLKDGTTEKDPELDSKVREILHEGDEVVTTPEEFIEVIDKVGNYSAISLSNSFKVKLEKTYSVDDQVKLLEKIREMQKKVK